LFFKLDFESSAKENPLIFAGANSKGKHGPSNSLSYNLNMKSYVVSNREISKPKADFSLKIEAEPKRNQPFPSKCNDIEDLKAVDEYHQTICKICSYQLSHKCQNFDCGNYFLRIQARENLIRKLSTISKINLEFDH
jgi:hypothetical protein